MPLYDSFLHGVGETVSLASAALRDVHGSWSVQEVPVKSEYEMVQARLEVSKALKALPREETQAYYEAMRVDQNMVMLESPFDRFLLASDFNSQKAAKNVSNYWKTRKDLFQSRFTKHMILSDEGALNQEDIEAVEAGRMLLVGMDKMKRAVITVDQYVFDRLKRPVQTETWLRASFYAVHAVSEMDLAVWNGMVFVILINSGHTPDPKFGPQITDLLDSQALPVPIRAIHTIVKDIPHRKARRSFPTLQKIVSFGLRLRVHKYKESLREEVLPRLKPFGIYEEHFPKSAGGTYDGLTCWLEERKILEEARKALIQSREAPPDTSKGNKEEETSSPIPLDARSAKTIADITNHDEANAALRDLYGESVVRDIPAKSKEEMIAAREGMQRAIEALPKHQVLAYREAIDMNPMVVELETPFDRFLLFCKYNVVDSANHFCNYWTLRKQLFGDRFYLPLTLDGKGALSYNDIANIDAGAHVVASNDLFGRAVLVYDEDLWVEQKDDQEARLRNVFYFGHVLSESNFNVVNGFVGIAQMSCRKKGQRKDAFMKMFKSQALPVMVRVGHFIKPSFSDAQNNHGFVRNLPHLNRWVYFRLRLKMHRLDRGEEVLKKSLEPYGLSLEHIPEKLRGLGKVQKWVRERLHFEKSQYTDIDVIRNAVAPRMLCNPNEEEISSSTMDALGTSVSTKGFSSKSQKDTLPDSTRACFVEAISLLPSQQTMAYHEALELDARIVEAETPLDRFLLKCDSNYWKAAEEMSRYWKKRKEVFGPERFWKPLTLLNEGALTRDEIHMLRKGIAWVSSNDASQRSVVIFDLSSECAKLMQTGTIRAKILFYFLHALSEDEGSLANGFVGILTLPQVDFASLVTPKGSMTNLVHSKAIPVDLHGVHLLTGRTDHAWRRGLDLILGKWKFLGERIVIHSSPDIDTILDEFGDYGLSAEHVPKTFGGIGNANKWLEDRLSSERERYSFLGLQDRSDQHVELELMNFLRPSPSVDDLSERLEAEHSLLGTRTVSTISKPDPSIVRAAIEGFHVAIAALPEESRSAYDEAKKLSPRVVEVESPAYRFLLACDFDYWAAAKRVALYWRRRSEIFGDRFARPLILGKEFESAFTPEDLEDLKCGGLQVSPTMDSMKRVVVLFDLDVTSASFQRNRLKFIFYALQVALESEYAVINGCVFIFIVHRKLSHIERDGKGFQLLHSGAFPIKLCALHLLSPHQHMTHSSVGWITERFSNTYKTKMHDVTQPLNELLDGLRPFGLSKSHLPSRLGGNCTFSEWASLRAKVEGRLYQDRPTTAASEEDQKKTLKRKMEDVYWYNKESMSRHKIARLEKDRKNLQSQADVLRACMVCVEHIAAEHENHKKIVKHAVQTIFQEVADRQPELFAPPAMGPEAFSNYFLTNLIRFRCKDFRTGAWVFARTQAPMPPGMDSFGERLQIQIAASQVALEEAPCNLDPLSLSREEAELRCTIEKLKRNNEKLALDGKFLESCTLICNDLTAKYSQYKELGKAELTELISSRFLAMGGGSTSLLTGALQPDNIAGLILNQPIWYVGQPCTRAEMKELLDWQSGQQGRQRPGHIPTSVVQGHNPSQDMTPKSSAAENSETTPGAAQVATSNVAQQASSVASSQDDQTRASRESRLSVDERRNKIKKRRKPHLQRL